MGDRINIAIKVDENDKEFIYLYSHWGGWDAPGGLKSAISHAKGRWGDSAYCTRIIVCHLIGKDQFDKTTGFGLSLGICDNDGYPVLLINIPDQKIELYKFDREKWEANFDSKINEWSFEDFLKIERVDWHSVYPEEYPKEEDDE